MWTLNKVTPWNLDKNAEEHDKKSGFYVNKYINQLFNRIKEVFELRAQHDELLVLLTQEEQDKFGVESLFDPFRSQDVFYVNEVTDKWKDQRA